MNEKRELIKYRLNRAKNTLKTVELLIENQVIDGNSISNRLYYACFYAVLALLESKDIRVKSHKTIKSQFGLHFIQTGIIDAKYGKMYSNLFDLRQEADYADLTMIEISDSVFFVEDAKDFIEIIEKVLSEN